MPGVPASRPRTGGRIETLIRVTAPLLDLLLAVGERLSRIVEPEDVDYVPARMFGDGKSAPRGLNAHGPLDGDRAATRG
jgi:hypothetical protein